MAEIQGKYSDIRIVNRSQTDVIVTVDYSQLHDILVEDEPMAVRVNAGAATTEIGVYDGFRDIVTLAEDGILEDFILKAGQKILTTFPNGTLALQVEVANVSRESYVDFDTNYPDVEVVLYVAGEVVHDTEPPHMARYYVTASTFPSITIRNVS